jgi:hypothetical protein
MLMVEHPNRSAAWEGATRARASENHFMFAEDNSEMGLGADRQVVEQWLRFPLSYYYLAMERHEGFADDQILRFQYAACRLSRSQSKALIVSHLPRMISTHRPFLGAI